MAQEHTNGLLVHPALLVERYLEKCQQSGELSDFLGAFELSARYRLTTKPLSDFWKSKRKLYSNVTCLDQLFKTILKFEIKHEISEVKRQETQINTDEPSEYIEALHAAGAAAAQEYIKFKQNKLPELLASPYASFPASWSICLLTEAWFKENDPAIVVADYLKMIYPNQAEPEPSLGFWGINRRLIEKPFLELAQTMSSDIVKQDHTISPTKRNHLTYAANAILGNINTRFVTAAIRPNAEAALAALRELPQCMFSGLLERAFDDRSSRVIYKGENLQQMFTNIGWLFSRCWPKNSRSDAKIANGHAYLIYRIACFFENMGFELDKNNYDEAIAIAYDEASAQWRSMLERYVDCVRRSVPMRSPIPIGDVHGLFGAAFGNSAPIDDYKELHSFLLLSDLAYDGISRFTPIIDGDYGLDDASLRWQFCIPYIQRLRVDGMSELSAALFAFLLFSQVRMFPTWMRDWPNIREELIEALKSPACPAVLRTVEYAMAMSSSRKDCLTLKLLQEFTKTVKADSATQASFGMVHILHPTRAEAESYLRKYLGSALWLRYATETQQFLIDAECKWAVSEPKFGKEAQDWGELAVVFCKPIEAELKRRLGTACASWQKGSSTEKPTMGTFVKLLREFNSLMPSVQSLILDAGVHIQDDPALIKKLKALTDFRNRGAHASKFDAMNIMAVKNLMYVEGLLRHVAERLD